MPGVSGFIFGKDALKKAAGESSPAPKRESANLDIGKMAQEQADRQLKTTTKKGPQKRSSKRASK